MAKTKSVKPKITTRPATGREPVVDIRLSQELIASVEAWGLKHHAESQSEAVRRLIEIGLSVFAPPRAHSLKTRAGAATLAHEAIDRHSDPSATHEERESRKRRLLKGPKEFRDMRKDHK